MTKKILYFDMDGVLVDYPSGLAQISPETLKEYGGKLDKVPSVKAGLKLHQTTEIFKLHF